MRERIGRYRVWISRQSLSLPLAQQQDQWPTVTIADGM
jgi:hypothetical protein